MDATAQSASFCLVWIHGHTESARHLKNVRPIPFRLISESLMFIYTIPTDLHIAKIGPWLRSTIYTYSTVICCFDLSAIINADKYGSVVPPLEK